MKKRVKKGALRGGLFLLAFFSFCYWTFPYERVAAFAIQQVEYPAGPGGVRLPSGLQLEIGNLSPHWLTGVKLEDVRITRASSHPDVPPGVVELPNVQVSVGVLPLLSQSVVADFELEVGTSGRITGRVDIDADEGSSLRADFNDVLLEDLGILRSFTGLPFTGNLSGMADFTVPPNVSESTGELQLTLRALSIGGDGAKLRVGRRGPLAQGITLDQVNAGDLALSASAESGIINIDELRSQGDDLTLCGNGSIQLNTRLSASRLNTLLRVEFSPAYRTRSEITEALFAALQFSPQARRAQTSDEDAYQFRLDGAVGGRVRFAPAGRAATPCTPSE